MRARKVSAAVIACLALAGAGVAGTVGFGLGGSGSEPRSASSNLPPATAQVTRQTLLDTEKTSGTLGHGRETTVKGRLTGTVTAVPDSGALVKRGEALYRVDNTPVLLLYGALPAYRTLAPGVEGDDVLQFEQNLRALGYTGFTVDDEYSSATATAVRKWQKSHGLTQSGVVEAGRIVYATGEVRVATVAATVGGQAQGEVLTYSGTERVVTVKLEVSNQRLAKTGAAVSVTLPGGTKATGTIAKVATIIEPGTGGAADKTKIEVTVSFAAADQAKVANWDAATVEVVFTATERKNVLTVPVAALLALAEGGYGVQVVDGTATRIVRVETGLFSGGRVEISGDGIAEGMSVGVPS